MPCKDQGHQIKQEQQMKYNFKVKELRTSLASPQHNHKCSIVAITAIWQYVMVMSAVFPPLYYALNAIKTCFRKEDKYDITSEKIHVIPSFFALLFSETARSLNKLASSKLR